jgi:4-carboxymuconolactone decarboxylase
MCANHHRPQLPPYQARNVSSRSTPLLGKLHLNFIQVERFTQEENEMSKITQTAGRNALGEFAPEFAHFNDDVLFGENWNNQDIDLKTRCIITVVALMAQGITDSSLKYHIQNAKNNGVTQREMAAVITHVAFYAGWPKAWAVFNLAKEVYNEPVKELTDKDRYQNTIFFPIGAPNDAYAKYFIGQSYLAPVSTEQVPIFNVTFEPGCRNNWHIHHAKSGGGQMLICVGGRGYYQEWGKEAVEMTPGTVVNIPADVKHWHGAAPDSWFSHLAVEVSGEETSNEWCEPVSDEEYRKAVSEEC